VEDHDQDVKYDLTAPADLQLGVDYEIRESHGLSVPLVVRLIVRKEQFQKEWTYDGDDLGAVYHRSFTDFALWAPTASEVILKVKNAGKTFAFAMRRTEKGVYRAKINGDLKRASYTYLIKRNGEFVESLDPYGLSSTGNSRASAVIDLSEVTSIPDYRPKTKINSAVDAVIYECSVRDMTASTKTGTKENGTFAALCEEGTSWRGCPTGFSYLASLGMTHVQVQPVGDFVTVDEFYPKKNYNWGYDPAQYMSLDGSFSLNPDDPYARMRQFRRLVTQLHQKDIRVTADVVFNHLYDVESSPYFKTVPYYYFRYNDSGYLSNGSYCGNDFDSRQPMARKLLLTVVKNWMEIYGLDGFRFDLMGIIDVDTMNEIRKTAVSIKPDALIYGEGWDMPTMLAPREKSCIQNQDIMPHIGHFNDYFRDVLKGKTSDDQKYQRGYLTGDLGLAYSALSALCANVLHEPYFFRFTEPDQTINGMETHDNSTMWDKMHACCGNEDRATRQKRQKMMLAATLVSQGVPFLHAGSEFCGSKNDNSNSYNAGDNINQMDWDRAAINSSMVEYTRRCIALRKTYRAFRLSSAEEIGNCVHLSVADGGIVFYDIALEDASTNTKCIRVMINPSFEERTYHFDSEWKVLLDEEGGSVLMPSYEVHVPALSLIVAAQ